MVIGISGRLGSGKDTVGKLIQYMTAEDVAAGCLGRIRGGLSIDGYHNSDFENKKFAGKLKLVGSILSGVPVEMFEDQDFKKLDMSPEWEMTYREFLQKLGTEAMRDGLHTNVWVNALFADYKELSVLRDSQGIKIFDEEGNHQFNYPNWLITDMRFPNEMDAVKDKGGITIRVNRPKPREMFLMNANTVIDTRVPEHPSETALDNADFDYVIENSGSFDDLMVKVEAILKKEQIPYKRWSI
jgi:hypothetical protein